MKISTKIENDQLIISMTLDTKEINDAFSRALTSYEVQNLIVKILTSQVGPLSQIISENIKLYFENNIIKKKLEDAMNLGISTAENLIKIEIGKITVSALKGSMGKFFESTFARMKSVLTKEMENTETAL
jgi:hypothetical protein